MNEYVSIPAAGPAEKVKKIYKVGTLQYTARDLAVLFVWMLWGDFCFTLMETVVPSILPLKLKALDASSFTIAFILGTIPCSLNIALNPVISFRSDRYRSRWGRRIPFLAVATPFLCLALILLGTSPEIGTLLHGAVVGKLTSLSPATTTLIVIGAFVMMFHFFNMFIDTVFWYFFNDVVPQAVMARFLGLFRMVGALAGTLYNYFIFQYAETHMRAIFTGAGLLYLTAFGLMCWRVREGEYPPPPLNIDGNTGFLASAKTYIHECTGHRFYWNFYLFNVFAATTGACGVFLVFLSQSLGLSLAQIGTINAANLAATTLLTYPAGAIADRHHPLRLMLWIRIALLITVPLGLVWLFTTFSPRVNYLVVFGLSIVQLPLSLISAAVSMPMFMRLLPKERFGQFCSCNALFQSVAGLATGMAAGGFIDLMRRLFPDGHYGKDFCYRFIPVWQIFFLGISLFFLVRLYRQWQRLGGDEHFRPPSGREPKQPAGLQEQPP